VFSLSHALFGLQPDAPQEMLYVDPDLPPWLNDPTFRNLRVGKQTVDIRFSRIGEKTQFDVLKGNPAAVACRDMTVWGELLKREVVDASVLAR
jgi:hypothetical protein